jgi:hypothetical protein
VKQEKGNRKQDKKEKGNREKGPKGKRKELIGAMKKNNIRRVNSRGRARREQVWYRRGHHQYVYVCRVPVLLQEHEHDHALHHFLLLLSLCRAVPCRAVPCRAVPCRAAHFLTQLN